MWHFFDISKVSIGKLRPYKVVPYVAMPGSHLLPLQVLSLFLCWYLLTLQRFTAQLVSSVPARVLSRLCEVPNQKAPLRLLCKTQVMSNLRGATNPKHIRFIHWMPLLIIWSHLGKSLDDYLQLRPSMNPCHADSNSVDGSSTLHQDKMSSRTQRQWLCCCDSDSWFRNQSLLAGKSYQGRLPWALLAAS